MPSGTSHSALGGVWALTCRRPTESLTGSGAFLEVRLDRGHERVVLVSGFVVGRRGRQGPHARQRPFARPGPYVTRRSSGSVQKSLRTRPAGSSTARFGSSRGAGNPPVRFSGNPSRCPRGTRAACPRETSRAGGPGRTRWIDPERPCLVRLLRARIGFAQGFRWGGARGRPRCPTIAASAALT